MFCLVALPAAWIAGSLYTGFDAVEMIPAAIAVALLSGLTAWAAGRGRLAALGYFLGTGAMMGVAFWIAIFILLTIACGDGYEQGVC